MVGRPRKSGILGDCTAVSINKSTVGCYSNASTDASLENETILSNNSNVPLNQLLGSSFIERVQRAANYSELSLLFPRGSLQNKKLKKKKKKGDVSISDSSTISDLKIDESISGFSQTESKPIRNVAIEFDSSNKNNESHSSVNTVSNSNSNKKPLKRKRNGKNILSNSSDAVVDSDSQKSLSKIRADNAKKTAQNVSVQIGSDINSSSILEQVDKNGSNEVENRSNSKTENIKKSSIAGQKRKYKSKDSSKSISISFDNSDKSSTSSIDNGMHRNLSSTRNNKNDQGEEISSNENSTEGSSAVNVRRSRRNARRSVVFGLDASLPLVHSDLEKAKSEIDEDSLPNISEGKASPEVNVEPVSNILEGIGVIKKLNQIRDSSIEINSTTSSSSESLSNFELKLDISDKSLSNGNSGNDFSNRSTEDHVSENKNFVSKNNVNVISDMDLIDAQNCSNNMDTTDIKHLDNNYGNITKFGNDTMDVDISPFKRPDQNLGESRALKSNELSKKHVSVALDMELTHEVTAKTENLSKDLFKLNSLPLEDKKIIVSGTSTSENLINNFVSVGSNATVPENDSIKVGLKKNVSVNINFDTFTSTAIQHTCNEESLNLSNTNIIKNGLTAEKCSSTGGSQEFKSPNNLKNDKTVNNRISEKNISVQIDFDATSTQTGNNLTTFGNNCSKSGADVTLNNISNSSAKRGRGRPKKSSPETASTTEPLFVNEKANTLSDTTTEKSGSSVTHNFTKRTSPRNNRSTIRNTNNSPSSSLSASDTEVHCQKLNSTYTVECTIKDISGTNLLTNNSLDHKNNSNAKETTPINTTYTLSTVDGPEGVSLDKDIGCTTTKSIGSSSNPSEPKELISENITNKEMENPSDPNVLNIDDIVRRKTKAAELVDTTQHLHESEPHQACNIAYVDHAVNSTIESVGCKGSCNNGNSSNTNNILKDSIHCNEQSSGSDKKREIISVEGSSSRTLTSETETTSMNNVNKLNSSLHLIGGIPQNKSNHTPSENVNLLQSKSWIYQVEEMNECSTNCVMVNDCLNVESNAHGLNLESSICHKELSATRDVINDPQNMSLHVSINEENVSNEQVNLNLSNDSSKNLLVDKVLTVASKRLCNSSVKLSCDGNIELFPLCLNGKESSDTQDDVPLIGSEPGKDVICCPSPSKSSMNKSFDVNLKDCEKSGNSIKNSDENRSNNETIKTELISDERNNSLPNTNCKDETEVVEKLNESKSPGVVADGPYGESNIETDSKKELQNSVAPPQDPVQMNFPLSENSSNENSKIEVEKEVDIEQNKLSKKNSTPLKPLNSRKFAHSPRGNSKSNKLREKRKSVTFASMARLKSDSQSGDITLALSPSPKRKGATAIKNVTSAGSQTGASEFDMSMTVGLSVIPRDDLDSFKGKKNCHSTPIKNSKVLGKGINNVQDKIVQHINEQEVFVRPEVPLRKSRGSVGDKSANLFKKRDRNEVDDSPSDDRSKDSMKRKKNIDKTINELSYDTLLDVSEIPLDKTIHQKKLIYHSTPINPVLEKKQNEKKKGQISINHSDKIIQVSKTIFGSSSDTVSGVSGKKSTAELSTSYSYEGKLSRSKRKLSSSLSELKRKKQINSEHSSKRSRKSELSTSLNSNNSIRSLAEEESSDGNNASNEESSTTRVLRSGSLYSSLTQSTRNDPLDTSYKNVDFRRYVSVIDSQYTLSTGPILSKGNVTLSDDSDKKNLFDVTSVTPTYSNRSQTYNSSKSELKSIINHYSVSKIKTRSSSLTQNNTTGSVSSIIIKKQGTLEGSDYSVSDSQLSSILNTKKNDDAVKNKGKISKLSLSSKRKMLKYNYSQDSRFMINGVPYVPPKAKIFANWVSQELLRFFLNLLKSKYDLEATSIAEHILSHLCATVSAVKMLSNLKKVDAHTIILRNVLKEYSICSNLLEYYTFIMKYTPFDFQRKVLPVGGYFGSFKKEPVADCKLGDIFITESEVVHVS